MKTQFARLVARFGRRGLVTGTASVVVLIALIATAIAVISSGEPEYELTAQFIETPGLYPHNGVDVLGVPSGHIVSVTPRQGYVDVVLALPKHIKVPANAQAVLMAPNPVSDRFVELTPPYAGGASMAPGSTIPLARTIVPLELDQIYDSVDNLSKALGPTGANKNGDLTAALHAFAQLANGNGADVHSAITSIAAALPALTQNPNELSQLITGLDSLTKTLAGRDSTIDALYSDLAQATSQLAGERQTIASAIANLQLGVQQVADFIRSNQGNITGAVQNLSTTVAAVMKEQQALIETFDTAPLGFQNINNAIDPDGACISATGAPHNCPQLEGRLDFTSDVDTLLTRYCGSSIATSLLPILEWNAHIGQASARETACGAEIGALAKRPGTPGAPPTPDLDLAHYVGS